MSISSVNPRESSSVVLSSSAVGACNKTVLKVAQPGASEKRVLLRVRFVVVEARGPSMNSSMTSN